MPAQCEVGVSVNVSARQPLGAKMFGTLRLALAAVVVGSHAGWKPFGIWVGVCAVVVFYLISGFAMTALLHNRFLDKGQAMPFYFERFVRLAPQYYFWLAISFISIYIFKLYSVDDKDIIPYGLFSYVTVIPLGMQFLIKPVNALVMPQASTLGIESSFYLISPWLLRSRPLSWIAMTICISIFAFTVFGCLPANIYTYYTTPAPMAFFLLGSFLYRKDWTSLLVSMIFLISIIAVNFNNHYEMEYLIGLIIGFPIVFYISRLNNNKIDNALGNASYGAYVCQIPILYFLEDVIHLSKSSLLLAPLAILVCSTLGYLTYRLIERPTAGFRRRIGT